MTDEEKKAIEVIKGLAVYYDDYSLLDEEEIEENEEVNNSINIVIDIIEKQAKEIEELKEEQEKEKNKDMSCDLTETRADNIDESTMLKQIKLKLQEKNIPIETLLAEFERLEDLEDDLTTVYLNGVYDGEKKVEDKIKARIKELEEYLYKGNIKDDFLMIRIKAKIQELQSLLEKE